MNLYLAYVTYAATGEGLSVFMAIGNTPESTEALLRKHTDDYYMQAMQGPIPLEEADKWVRDWIPKRVRKFGEGQPAVFGWFQKFHFNAS